MKSFTVASDNVGLWLGAGLIQDTNVFSVLSFQKGEQCAQTAALILVRRNHQLFCDWTKDWMKPWKHGWWCKRLVDLIFLGG